MPTTSGEHTTRGTAATTIDLQVRELEVDFIKVDIEGSERQR